MEENRMAKSAVEAQPVVAPPAPAHQESLATWEGIPLDFLRHFYIDVVTASSDDIEQLKNIYEWSKSKYPSTIGDALSKLRELEDNMGALHFGEKRHVRIWQFLKMDNYIKDLEKRRDALVGRKL